MGGLVFGRGMTSVHFHISGTKDSHIELFTMEANGPPRFGAKSRITQLGTPSGHGALCILMP